MSNVEKVRKNHYQDNQRNKSTFRSRSYLMDFVSEPKPQRNMVSNQILKHINMGKKPEKTGKYNKIPTKRIKPFIIWFL